MAVVDYAVANGKIVSETRGGTHRFYHADALGSTVALYNDSQTKTDWFKYWPYGEIRDSLDVTGTPMKFIGTEGCPTQADGSVYMRAREVDPENGRWLSVDPLWPGQCAYEYIYGDPTSGMDPTGLWPCGLDPGQEPKPKPCYEGGPMPPDWNKCLKEAFKQPACSGSKPEVLESLFKQARCIMCGETGDCKGHGIIRGTCESSTNQCLDKDGKGCHCFGPMQVSCMFCKDHGGRIDCTNICDLIKEVVRQLCNCTKQGNCCRTFGVTCENNEGGGGRNYRKCMSKYTKPKEIKF